MVGRPGKFQPRFTAGQLDALMQANTDVDMFAKGAATMQNARPLPQGGFTRRDGTTRLGRVRCGFDEVTFGGAAFPFEIAITPAGYNLVLPLEGGFVTAVDLWYGATTPGGAQPGYGPPSPPESPLIQGNVTVLAQAGGVTTQIGATLGLVDTARLRRFSLPPGQTAAATQVEILFQPNQNVDLWVLGLQMWVENGLQPAAAVVKPFASDQTHVYDLVFQPGGVDVYGASGWLASVPVTQSPAAVTTFKYVQSLATMILFHTSYWPKIIERQGSDYDWDYHNAPFGTLPAYDFGDKVYPNVTEMVWDLVFYNCDTQLGSGTPPLPSGGVHFTLTVNGQTTQEMQYPPMNPWNMAATMQAAILALPGVAPGLTVALQGFGQNLSTFVVYFTGAGNAGNGWAISGRVFDKSDAAITATLAQQAVAPGEPIMSPARGYPAAGVLYQQRLLIGGFLSAPMVIVASQAGDVWNIDTSGTATAVGPMLLELEGQANEQILDLHVGRTCDVFTAYGEWWFQPGALSAVTPPMVVYSTSNGIAPGVDPVESEGATIFVHANRGLILQYTYDWGTQNYLANSLSVQASSVVRGVRDNALRRAIESVDTNEHYLVLDDGTVTTLSLKRDQQINAFAKFVTDGQVIAVDVNNSATANLLVVRQVNGAPVLFLEAVTPGQWLDCAQFHNVAAGQATIPGLTDFVGATVWALVDGFIQGPFVVDTTATIALAFPAELPGTATVGRWTPLIVETLPLPRDVGPRTVVRGPGRAHTVRATLVDATNFAIAANGSAVFECALSRWGGVADVPSSAYPFTGWVVAEGLLGFLDDVQVTITQTRPGALTVTGVTIEADL